MGGFWSSYWYNGRIYGAEIARGIDVFRLTPGEHLSEAEIAAAELVLMSEFNAQLQPMVEWPNELPVAQAYLDQMVRHNRITDARAQQAQTVLSAIGMETARSADISRLAADLEGDAAAVRAGTLGGDADRLAKLAGVLRGIGG